MEADYGMTEMAFNAEQHNRTRGDENLFVQFYKGAVQDREKSLAEGRPIFRDTEFVKIIVPGDKSNIIDREARDADRHRFRKHYEAFKANEQEYVEGTRLEHWGFLSLAQVEELKHYGIVTVEQLANVNDSTAQNFLGFQNLKTKAQEYLDASGDGGLAKLQDDLAHRDAQIEEQAKMIADLTARLDALEE